MLAPRLKANGRAFAQIAQYIPELVALRHDLHAHPELGFEEVYTSRRVVEALKVCGVDEIHTGIGKTGVVAPLRCAAPREARRDRVEREDRVGRPTEVVGGQVLERPLERLQHLAERAGGRRARATRGDGGTPAAAAP